MKDVDYQLETCWVECDECGKNKYIDSTDYSDINEQLRDYDWVIRKIKGDWYEFCSRECYRKFLKGE